MSHIEKAAKDRFLKKAEPANHALIYDAGTKAIQDSLSVSEDLAEVKATLAVQSANIARVTDLQAKQLKNTYRALDRLAEKDKAPVDPMDLVADTSRAIEAVIGAEILRRAKQVDSFSQGITRMVGTGKRSKATAALAGKLVHKSATDTATTTAAGWLAEIVESDTLPIYFEPANASIFGYLIGRGQRVRMGRNNSMTMPIIEAGAGFDLMPFIAENATIPTFDGTIGSQTFNRFKVGGIVPYTIELAQTSTPNIRTVVRRGLLDTVTASVDRYLLDGTAPSAGLRPASITYNAPSQASAGATIQNIITDVKWIATTLNAAKAVDPILLMNPASVIALKMAFIDGVYPFRDEVDRGSLFGMAIFASRNCPVDEVIGLDADAFAGWAELPQIDVRDAGTLVAISADGAAPAMGAANGETVDVSNSVKVSDAAGVAGGPAVVTSLFQSYLQAVRLIAPVSWTMTRTAAAARLVGVQW